MSPLRVSVLAYPGCFASEVFGVPDLLAMATHVAAAQGTAQPSYETSVVSPRRRVIASGAVASRPASSGGSTRTSKPATTCLPSPRPSA
ncbi:hypothetical protein ACIA98_22940 [Streptomyces sp. NPDC051366]|uniref:hypothetical protein n=1 Tax=Streptomyces sp. NPDC051366 TaxID=3365652 RepID=UPI0037AB314E